VSAYCSSIRAARARGYRWPDFIFGACTGGPASILFGCGAGSEVMSWVVAPTIGSMLTAPLLSALAVTAGYRPLLRRRRRRQSRVDCDSQVRRSGAAD